MDVKKTVFHKVTRTGEATNLIFIGGFRLDPASTIMTDDNFKKLSATKAFKEYKANGTIESTPFDPSDEDARKSALADVKSAQAKRNADELFTSHGVYSASESESGDE